jgi:hypothetical protein
MLRHCGICQKAMASIRNMVIGIFHSRNPTGRSMALESIHPLTEMSTTGISLRVKAAGA